MSITFPCFLPPPLLLSPRRSLRSYTRHPPLIACDSTSDLSYPAPTPPSPSFTPSTPPPPPPQISLMRITRALWPFTRPHTFYGSILSVTSLTTLSRQLTPAIPPSLAVFSFLTALIPALFLNLYITGLNQISDIDIDKINKPFLPIPAGLISKKEAILIIIAALVAALSFCFSPLATPALRIVLVVSTMLGTMYSIPPFRLKRFALLASVAILSVRGLLVNTCFFLHGAAAASSTSLPSLLSLPPQIIFATLFFVLFSVVIALLKDAPDIRGDRLYGIRTFSVRLGASTIFNACTRMLVAMFVVAAIFYFCTSKSLIGRVLAGVTHLGMAFVLAKRARKVDTADSKQIYAFYMFSWKAFYLEYILLPVTAL